MSYSTDPVTDAQRHTSQLSDWQERQEHAEQDAINEFLQACCRADANALATFAPTVTDWDAMKRQPYASDAYRIQRTQTFAEVLDGTLDYGKGPNQTELMQLLLNVAYGSNVVNAPEQARDLLNRMCAVWVSHNVPTQD